MLLKIKKQSNSKEELWENIKYFALRRALSLRAIINFNLDSQ